MFDQAEASIIISSYLVSDQGPSKGSSSQNYVCNF